MAEYGVDSMTEESTSELSGQGRRLSRRRFLQAAATLPILGAAGCVAAKGASTGRTPKVSLKSAYEGPTSEFGLNPQPITVIKKTRSTSGYVFLTEASLAGYDGGPAIIDDDGELVWFLPLKTGTVGGTSLGFGSTNLQVQAYKGEPVLTWWQGKTVLPGYGQGYYEIYDSAYQQVAQVHAGNGLQGDLHEFTLTPQGTALLTAYRTEQADLTSVGGAASGTILNSLFQEVDVATGEVLFEWDATQHVPFSDSYAEPPSSASELYDWFHINSVSLDTDGNYLISSRHLWSVFKIDRSSGDVIWKLNGKGSNFTMGPGAVFAWQHHVRRFGSDMLTIFDDGAGIRNTEKQSRGLVLLTDEKTMTATVKKQYLPDPSILATSQGSCQALPNGDVFIGWGSEPYFSQYTESGEQIYNARLPLKSHSYRAFRFPWVGTPTTRPEVSASRSGTDKVVVSVSWNGATEVKRWDVLTGRTAATLRSVASFPKEGFVTQMAVKSTDKLVMVRALGAGNEVLAGSEIVTV